MPINLKNIEVRTIKTLADDSISIQLVTQELSSENMTELFKMKKKGFSEEGIIFEQKEGKTPHERLRAVLYILFTQENEGYTDFNLFYQFKMEQFINHVKNKINT